MNGSISLKLIVTLCCCFVTLVFIINASLNDLDSHASPVIPEKNSTFSNSSETDSNDTPATTIIIPTGGSTVTQVSSSSNNNNDTVFAIQSNNDTINETQNNNVSNLVPNNNTISDPQQRGKYLVDDNGVHYYNINNCSEKKGSSGIGNMSECEDAEKEMSED
ncbi:hypothetical protein [Candidatus Nitrosocosmicus sp. T]